MISSHRFIPLPLMLLLCLSVLAVPAGADVYPPHTPVTLTFHPGWNLVSIPYYLSIFKNTPAIFDEAEEQGHSLFMYNGETRQWYIPGRERIFRPVDTLWVYTARSFTLTLDPFPETYSGVYTRTLYPGWNLVGITGDTPIPAKYAFPDLADRWQTIIGYDPSTRSFTPLIMNGGTGQFSDDQDLLPGRGYWIFLTEGGTIRYG